MIVIIQGTLTSLSFGAAVCSKQTFSGAVGSHGSEHRCKHLKLKTDGSETGNLRARHLSSKPHYISTPSPPIKTRELPKNPYADYVDYYSQS